MAFVAIDNVGVSFWTVSGSVVNAVVVGIFLAAFAAVTPTVALLVVAVMGVRFVAGVVTAAFILIVLHIFHINVS